MKKKRILISVLLISLTVLCGFGISAQLSRARRADLQRLLHDGNLKRARVVLNGDIDWQALLQEMERTRDHATIQAALDVQFEYWYAETEDTNYQYPEHPDVISKLLSLGAVPGFDHLVRATSQNKMATARLLLDAGVPAFQTGSVKSPLANVAYWGDLKLLEDLLRRGADVNQAEANGWTAILAAAWSCRTDCVRLLLEKGADVTLPYEVWGGHSQPIWQVIKERAVLYNRSSVEVWDLVRPHVPQQP